MCNCEVWPCAEKSVSNTSIHVNTVGHMEYLWQYSIVSFLGLSCFAVLASATYMLSLCYYGSLGYYSFLFSKLIIYKLFLFFFPDNTVLLSFTI